MTARGRAAVLSLVAAAGCYHVDNRDCEIRCGAGEACPTGLACARGFCVEDGQTCADPDLVLAYSFDDGDATLVPDDSAHGNAAGIEGAVRGPGVHGDAMTFDGDNDVLVTRHSPSLAVAPNGALTISFWIEVAGPGPFPADQLVIGKVRDNDQRISPFYEFGIEFDNSLEVLELFLTDDLEQLLIASQVTVPFDQFTHVAFTWDGQVTAGYVDGVLQPFDPGRTFDITVLAYDQDLRIGGQPDRAEFFTGALDDVRLYNRALTAEEIVLDRDRGVTP